MKINPWISLPTKPPFLLPDDRCAVDEFNQKSRSKNLRIQTEMLPEPFIGSLDAPLVILLENPGAGGGEEDFALHRRPSFQRRVRACHRQEAVPYPHYFVDPKAEGPGARWTESALKSLIEDFGRRVVASGVVFFEYFPYHSKNFGHSRIRVPSRDFTFQALQQAIRRGGYDHHHARATDLDRSCTGLGRLQISLYHKQCTGCGDLTVQLPVCLHRLRQESEATEGSPEWLRGGTGSAQEN